MGKRAGEEDAQHSQTERFYEVSGEWFFKTRDSGDKGPFVTKQEAESKLAAYVRHKLETGQFKF